MKKANIVKLIALFITLTLSFSIIGCTTGGTGGTSSNADSSSILDSSIPDQSSGEEQPPQGFIAGTEGWYVLTDKTVDGKNITDTFKVNAIKLEGGIAYIHAVDYAGLTVQEGTYTVNQNSVTIQIGIRPYEYVVDFENNSMEYNGKVNKQQVKMRYQYSKDFALDGNTNGVKFTDELFGESLDENFYNYCPSAMLEGNNIMHVWYCSNKVSGNVTDYIAYRKGVLNDSGKWEFSEKQLVLQPTADTWDSRHTCDPSVVKGNFNMGGTNYSYLMAYLGCYTSNGCCNEVGIAVAQKPEGPWVKVDSLNPIANFYTSEDYNESSWGYGQPCVISSDTQGKVFLIYTKGVKSGTYAYIEEWDFSNMDSPKLLREIRTSDSGVVNASGQKDVINNADFAYDPHLQRLYCIKEDFPYPSDGNTDWITGSNTILYVDLGDAGLETIFGSYMWNVAGKINSATTGYARNHNMCILTDEYGRLTNPYQIPVIYTRSDLREDYPDWELGGQWPALHTYRLYGYVIETK